MIMVKGHGHGHGQGQYHINVHLLSKSRSWSKLRLRSCHVKGHVKFMFMPHLFRIGFQRKRLFLFLLNPVVKGLISDHEDLR